MSDKRQAALHMDLVQRRLLLELSNDEWDTLLSENNHEWWYAVLQRDPITDLTVIEGEFRSLHGATRTIVRRSSESGTRLVEEQNIAIIDLRMLRGHAKQEARELVSPKMKLFAPVAFFSNGRVEQLISTNTHAAVRRWAHLTSFKGTIVKNVDGVPSVIFDNIKEPG